MKLSSPLLSWKSIVTKNGDKRTHTRTQNFNETLNNFLLIVRMTKSWTERFCVEFLSLN